MIGSMSITVKRVHRKNPRGWSPLGFRVALAYRGWTLKRLWRELETADCDRPSYQYASRAWAPDGSPGPASPETRAAIAQLLQVEPNDLSE